MAIRNLVAFGVVSAIALLSAGASAETVPGWLNKNQVAVMLSGNSLAGNGNKKDPQKPYDWIANYHKNGVIRIQLKPAWGGGVSEGKWWMKEDGQTCRKFETGRQIREGCWRVYRDGKFIRMRLSSGKGTDVRAAVLPGIAIMPKTK